jgi:hypothetical protein
MLNERDLSSIAETNAGVSENSDDDSHANKSVDSPQSAYAPSEQAKITSHEAIQHSTNAKGSKGASKAATKMVSRGTLNDPVPPDRALTPALRETNAKRRYQRRNSVVLPPRGKHTLRSLDVTVNIIPTDDPTIEEIQRIVLANAVAFQTQEGLRELRNAETSQINQRFLENHDVTASAPRPVISKDSKADTMGKAAEKVCLGDPIDATSETGTTEDLEAPCRVKRPSRASRNVKISQSERSVSDIPPLTRNSLQGELIEGVSTKRPFLDLEQCVPPRALVSVVSPCNETGGTKMVDLDQASMQIDSSFFSETESMCPESKTLRAKGSGRCPPRLAMRKLSRVVNTKSKPSANDNLEINADPKDPMRTEGKRFKRSDQSERRSHDRKVFRRSEGEEP